jgi:DNA-binding transcriptional ArsR family regulator
MHLGPRINSIWSRKLSAQAGAAWPVFRPRWLDWLAGRNRPAIIWRMTGIDCIAALKALGELNRMRIVRLLLKGQLGVNQISERLKMSQYNVSKHLRVLKEAGLVEMEKEGQQRLYAVVPRLKNQLPANKNVLELGCCTFRFDKLPR